MKHTFEQLEAFNAARPEFAIIVSEFAEDGNAVGEATVIALENNLGANVHEGEEACSAFINEVLDS